MRKRVLIVEVDWDRGVGQERDSLIDTIDCHVCLYSYGGASVVLSPENRDYKFQHKYRPLRLTSLLKYESSSTTCQLSNSFTLRTGIGENLALSFPCHQYAKGTPHTMLALILAAVAVVYTLGGMIYRLYFSPIAGFPGPKLAALTYWYEFYYDVVKDGQYLFHIDKLHKRYGRWSAQSLG